MWHQVDAYKMVCSSTSGMKGRQVTWKLDLHAPTSDNGALQGFPLSLVLYSVSTKGLVNLNSNGLSFVLALADDGLFYKTTSDSHTAVTAVSKQLQKILQWCKETGSEINPSKVQVV